MSSRACASRSPPVSAWCPRARSSRGCRAWRDRGVQRRRPRPVKPAPGRGAVRDLAAAAPSAAPPAAPVRSRPQPHRLSCHLLRRHRRLRPQSVPAARCRRDRCARASVRPNRTSTPRSPGSTPSCASARRALEAAAAASAAAAARRAAAAPARASAARRAWRRRGSLPRPSLRLPVRAAARAGAARRGRARRRRNPCPRDASR